jgi:hypothetical protein
MTGGRGIDIRVDRIAGSMVLLSPAGILDSRSYLTLRTAMVKAAVEEPTPVLIDVDELVVPAASAWSVLTSADAMTLPRRLGERLKSSVSLSFGPSPASMICLLANQSVSSMPAAAFCPSRGPDNGPTPVDKCNEHYGDSAVTAPAFSTRAVHPIQPADSRVPGPQTEMYWNGPHIGRIYPVPGSTTVKRLT